MTEKWKPIQGFEGFYEVSTAGRVRSLIRATKKGRRGGGVLNPQPCGKYFTVTLHRLGTKRVAYLHALVLETFVGPRPSGHDACHYPDPNPANCNLDNLRWDTRKANRQDTVASGRQQRGERHPMAKLTESDVRQMFQLKRSGLSQSKIASRFSVSVSQVSLIFLRKEWRHVQVEEAA